MTKPLVDYALDSGIATLTMDDGKVNVMSETMLAALAEAFDRAEKDQAVVLLTGRPRIFSGGYDTGMFTRTREEILRTLRAGGGLAHRMLGFSRPIVIACGGHAIAQGAFFLLAADVRIGAEGDFKIGLNEAQIGLTIPHYGIEIARLRLTPPWFNHATVTGTLYPPQQALAAGFFDAVVPHETVLEAARAEAVRMTKIDGTAHEGIKQRVRGHTLKLMREGIDAEFPAL
jgi:enoyl-CoA hydratase